MGDEVVRAAREGRGEDVIRMLEQDPSLIYVTDHTDSHGDTILHLVSRSSAHDAELVRELVKFLEDKGLRKVLLEQNSDGNTPLHLALFTHPVNHLVVNHLYWANPKAQDVVNEDGVSPRLLIPKDILQGLPVKVSSSDIEMRSVYQALDGDEDEDEDEDEETIDLSLAVKRGKEDLVQQILEEDPSLIWYKDPWLQWRPYPNATWYKKHKWTPLHDAARAGRVTMLRLLMRFMTPYHELMSSTLSGDQTDPFNSMTPLGITLHKGHKEAAFYLIQTAPHTAYQVNLSGTSPLHLAVKKGYEDIVRYIFQFMPANAVSSSIKHSLFAAQKKKSLANAAIKTANIGILKAIMKELPDLINIPDSKGWRPLSYAAYRGYLQGVCYLLANFPVYVKKYDWDGSLPIHKAVGGGHVSVVKAFCSHWPETLSKVDRKGRSVLHYAVMCAKADVLQYLTEELQVQVSKLYSLRDVKGNTFLDQIFLKVLKSKHHKQF